MSNYVWGTNIRYHDYLQAKSFEDAFRGDISTHTRSLIASNEELHREQISISKSLSKTVSGGFEQLSCDMQLLAQGVSELNATFQWGFSELLGAVGHINDTLTELARIAKAPEKTWAYEQFEEARDAVRKGLYDEALEYLNRAICGHAGKLGYKLEYRFHYLLGTIRIGSFKNYSSDIVDLWESEKAFLNAAKYARHDRPKEAGLSYLAAGWAAYCQGKLPDAQGYTEQAISLYPDFAEAHFQLAKIHMHGKNPQDALPFLRKAIEGDRGYSIKAAIDGDFKAYDAEVSALIGALKEETKIIVEGDLITMSKEVADAEGRGVKEFPFAKYANVQVVRRALQEATRAAAKNTYYGYLEAMVFCTQARRDLATQLYQWSRGTDVDIKKRISDLTTQIIHIEIAPMRWWWATLMITGITAFFIIACARCGAVYDANNRQERIRSDAIERIRGEIRAKGFDPNRLTDASARALGIRAEDVPPINIGRTSGDIWFTYFVGGTVASVVVALLGNLVEKGSKVAVLNFERDRLQRVHSQLHATK